VSPGHRGNGFPDFVNEALLKKSEDVLIGIGTYTIGNDMTKIGMGKTMAETRARVSIAQALNSMTRSMVQMSSVSSEFDPDARASFELSVSRTLSHAELKGAQTKEMNIDDNGVLWVVMEYSKSAAIAEVNQAVNAAKLEVPAAINFNLQQLMDDAFAKEAGGVPVPVSN
jgi:hypothetical protein